MSSSVNSSFLDGDRRRAAGSDDASSGKVNQRRGTGDEGVWTLDARLETVCDPLGNPDHGLGTDAGRLGSDDARSGKVNQWRGTGDEGVGTLDPGLETVCDRPENPDQCLGTNVGCLESDNARSGKVNQPRGCVTRAWGRSTPA